MYSKYRKEVIGYVLYTELNNQGRFCICPQVILVTSLYFSVFGGMHPKISP